MNNENTKKITEFYLLGCKHEKEAFKNYLLYYINENININNRDMEELKNHNEKEAIKNSIERLEAKNEILKSIKDYILFYADTADTADTETH